MRREDSSGVQQLVPPAFWRREEVEVERRWRAAYSLSKLAQVMHAVELQKQLDAHPDSGSGSVGLKVSRAKKLTLSLQINTNLPLILPPSSSSSSFFYSFSVCISLCTMCSGACCTPRKPARWPP